MSRVRFEDFLQDSLLRRRRRLRSTSIRDHKGFKIIEIRDRKPPCVVCGKRVPRGRHYTCHNDCQIKENLRVEKVYRLNRASQRPKMPTFSRRLAGALGRLFG